VKVGGMSTSQNDDLLRVFDRCFTTITVCFLFENRDASDYRPRPSPSLIRTITNTAMLAVLNGLYETHRTIEHLIISK